MDDNYIIIGTTIIRDPVTGKAIDGISMYVRAEESEKMSKSCQVNNYDYEAMCTEMARLFGEYVNGCRANGIKL